ncbi:MAG: signal peptidase I [Ruminococcus sp.]|nr:signal peptidase I [Ruminococcus sp.]
MKLKDKLTAKIPEQKREKVKKTLNVLRIIKNIVCWTLIIILSFAVITFLLTRFTGGTPSLFGYTLQRVSSGSMVPELEVGDVILSRNLREGDALNEGDIITFDGSDQFGEVNVTHRVIVVPHDENGVVMLQTKGDANDIADNPIEFSRVKSIVLKKLSFLRTIYDMFLSPWGLLIFIALLLLVFFDELMNIIKIATGNYRDEDEESISEIIERIQREDMEKEEEKKRLSQKKSRDLANLMSYRAIEDDSEPSDGAEVSEDDRPEE